MTALIDMVLSVSQAAPEESYSDLMRSGPHWLFELTLELITAPVAFALGWLWRQGLLRHVHRDLRALGQDPAVRGGPAPAHSHSHRKTRSAPADCPQRARPDTRPELRRPPRMSHRLASKARTPAGRNRGDSRQLWRSDHWKASQIRVTRQQR